MSDELLKTHTFCFNDYTNSGESLILTTKMYLEGNEVVWHQFLTLNSYSNSASFNLYDGPLTSKSLRKLADELESLENEIK